MGLSVRDVGRGDYYVFFVWEVWSGKQFKAGNIPLF